MILDSLRAYCKTPGGPGSILRCSNELVRATGVSGRIVYGVGTNLHFANVGIQSSERSQESDSLITGTGVQLE